MSIPRSDYPHTETGIRSGVDPADRTVGNGATGEGTEAARHSAQQPTPQPAAQEGAQAAVHPEQRIGTVLLDDAGADNASIHIAVGDEGRAHFRRELYVSIEDREQDIEFLGRVVEGPFHKDRIYEDGPGRDGSVGSEAGYDIVGVVEILGQLADGVRLVPTPVRPRPESEVRVFPADRLRGLLGIHGNIYLGRLIGGEGVRVHMSGDDKNFLPRNVGIFGTVGSGKSNTIQVLMEEALQGGWAVVTIDVEGEYVRMNDPTDDPRMAELLRDQHGLEPRGVDDFHVYVPASGRSDAEAPKRFKVPISAMEPEILADILEFSESHMRMFEAATKQAASRNEYINRSAGARTAQAGAAGASSSASSTTAAASAPKRPYTLQDLIDGLQESNQSVPLIPRIRAEDLPTAASLRAKLVHLGRSDVLDWNATEDVPEVPIDELVVGGRLSVLDVAEADDRSRNIAIAYTLQALFERVVGTAIGERMPSGQIRPPLLVVMEEVHTFVSRATAHRMRAVLDNLQVISRRGRKRWMALALVSQQPNHVPDELFELANTRFMHQMKSASNVDAVKNTTGGVHEALWSTVSSLGPGQCLLSSSAMNNAILLAARPARSRRALTR